MPFLGEAVVPIEVLGDDRLQLDQDRAVRVGLGHGDLRCAVDLRL
jgi:hypothetical protein